MRRGRAALPALVGAAALALAGCTGGAAGTRSESPAANEARATGDWEGTGESQTLTVFAAASLAKPMEDLLDRFAQNHPEVQVRPAVFDGSSTLVTQLIEGADADVLATANTATMDRLITEREDISGRPELFATNTLVIAVPEGNPQGIDSLADLNQERFVVCAPKVPCGAAAQELFEISGFDGAAISQEQNVTAAARRVLTGAADAALVYATDVASRADELDAVVPNKADQVVNQYPIITLNHDSPAAREFTELVQSDEGQAVLESYGFGSP